MDGLRRPDGATERRVGARRTERPPADRRLPGAARPSTGMVPLSCGSAETKSELAFDRTPTKAARELILEQVKRLMPGLLVATIIEQTAALRPVTPDDMPVIGLAPGWTNVGLALAGGRKGMLYSAGMGLAAAELVTRAETNLPIAACVPSRFRA